MNSIFSGLYKSFYSKTFYQEVAREWEAKPFVYLLVLLLVTGTLLLAYVGFYLMHTMKPVMQDLLGQVPLIHVVNGHATAEGPQPLTLKAHIGGKEIPMGMIDTTDHFKSIEETGVPMLLTSHEFITVNKGEKRIYSLTRIENKTIDAAWLHKSIGIILALSTLVTIPIMLVVFYGYQLIKSLLYAVVGLGWNAFFGARLSYNSLLRLSIVAMTPSFILGFLLFLKRPAHLPAFVYIFLTIAYLGFAVWANIPSDAQ